MDSMYELGWRFAEALYRDLREDRHFHPWSTS